MQDLLNHSLPSCTETLPVFGSNSDLTGLPNLKEYDIDEQLPVNMQSRYFTLSELASVETNANDLIMLHTNIRSLSSHLDELMFLCDQTTKLVDVIGVSETWSSIQKEPLTNTDIEGYNFYQTKSLSQNGGVGLYVKKPFISSSCENLNFECNEFEHRIEILSILCFNINLLRYDEHAPTNDFINNLFSYNFLPCINHPTRISEHSSTIIDNIFINLINANVISGNILTQISDHLPQFLILKNANIPHHKLAVLKSDYSRYNEGNFVSDFNETEFSYLNGSSDINNNYDQFLKDITLLVEKHVPTKQCSKKESKLKGKPWINYRVQKMMKIRDRILRKLKRKRSASNIALYKKFRNRVSNELKKSKQRYFQNYFTTYSQNIKKLWSGMKNIISHKNCSTSVISQIKDKNGNISYDPAEISNIFNDYFVNVADCLAKNIPRTPKSALDYLRNKNGNSMFLTPVTPLEIEDIIANLDSTKSIGPFSIPINLLQVLKGHISHPLAKLINQSFVQGIVPSKLKVAKVIPLFKQGDSKMLSNYRPISLLPMFSKLYEKAMHKRLYSFVTSNNIIHPLQFGFQENHSVDHALISITEAIRSTLDNKKYGCGVFIDLQKAFDSVNHNLLLSKLEHYGMRGDFLLWLSSYLSNRHQYVSVNGRDSNLMTIAYGVPQGSVLGPLLFLLFINDLPGVSKKLKFYLFADDTNIYYETDTPDKLAKKVNTELKYVKQWLDANKLSLNINKTNYMFFHSPGATLPVNAAIKIGNRFISRVKYMKFLGLLLDEHLCWKYHLSQLSKKLSRTCGILLKIRNYLPTDILRCIYNSLFMSFLQYGIVVWGQTFSSYIEPIFKLQKKAIRTISHQTAFSHSLPLFKGLHLLRVSDVFKYKLLTFVYDSMTMMAPSCFHGYFSLSSTVHNHETRQSCRNDLYLIRKNTLRYGLGSIRYLGSKLWNELPREIRASASRFIFKKKLQKHLLEIM